MMQIFLPVSVVSDKIENTKQKKYSLMYIYVSHNNSKKW